ETVEVTRYDGNLDGTNDSTINEDYTFDKFGNLIQLITGVVNHDGTIDPVETWTQEYDYRNHTCTSSNGIIETNGLINYFDVSTGLLNEHRQVVFQVMNLDLDGDGVIDATDTWTNTYSPRGYILTTHAEFNGLPPYPGHGVMDITY